MKSISAAIIVLSGAIILATGSLVKHFDTQSFLQLLGGAIGLYGLVKWHRAFHQPDE